MQMRQCKNGWAVAGFGLVSQAVKGLGSMSTRKFMVENIDYTTLIAMVSC